MKTKKLGSSDLEVSSIALGAWGIGGPPFWGERNEDESVKTIQKAIDCGVNLIDTAPVYGFGRSEEIIGKAIRGRRDKVLLATKCGLRWKEPVLRAMYKNLSPGSIWEELEASLARLKTDYIDLYQIHWPDPNSSLEQTLMALTLLKAQGKIRHFGVSNFDFETLARAYGFAPIDSIQPKYNMLERGIEADTLPYCVENNIGVLAYSPLASGVLTGKYGAETKFDGWRGKGDFGVFRKEVFGPAMEKVRKLKEVSGDLGVPLTHLAIKWVIDKPGVTSALVGANTPGQVEENVKAASIEVSDSVWGVIDDILDN